MQSHPDYIRPLTRREVEVYLTLVHELMSVAEIMAAQLRAMEIVARNPDTSDAAA